MNSSLRALLPTPLRAGLSRLKRAVVRRDDGVWYSADHIDELVRVYLQQGSLEGGPWDPYRDAHMRLPDWFAHGLDPWGQEYAAQQRRLWALIAGVDRDYEPEIDEKEFGWVDIDPVRSPAFYARRDPLAIASASDHVLATGMYLKHCGLKAGDWALEYGAGFGQTALALARLGCER